MYKILLIIFVTSMAVLAQDSVLTAREAIELGLKNNFNIQIARNNRTISQNNKGLGTAGFLPTLDVQGSADYSKTEQESNSPYSFGNTTNKNYGGQIMLNWTLFDGLKMFADKRRYDELAKLGEYQARAAIENTVLAILQTYFNLIQQVQLLEVTQTNLQISRDRLRKEEVRSELGASSSTDLLNARVSFNNDRTTFLNQQLRVDIARKDLNVILGRSPDILVVVEKDIPLPLLDLTYEEIQKLAEERNSALAVVFHDKLAAEQNVLVNRSPFFPRMSTSGSYVYSDQTVERAGADVLPEILTERTDVRAGVTLSWNLFNGVRDKVRLQNARIESKNKNLAYRDVKNQLAGLIREKYDTFVQRLEVARLEEENTEAARQNLERHQERYAIGTSTSLEFRDAQVNLARAQATYINARYQSLISRLEIDQLIGSIEVD